jgi:hypothetical protein
MFCKARQSVVVMTLPLRAPFHRNVPHTSAEVEAVRKYLGWK